MDHIVIASHANRYSHDQIYYNYRLRLRIHLPWSSWSYCSTLSDFRLTRSRPHSNSEACLTRSRLTQSEACLTRSRPHKNSEACLMRSRLTQFEACITRSCPHSFRGLPHEVSPSPIPRLASQGLALTQSEACLMRSRPHSNSEACLMRFRPHPF